MYNLTPEMYQDLAAAVLQSLSNISYFNGSVSAFDGATECRLTATLIIYRRRVDILSGETDSITGVVPVWWECHTEIDGVEIDNDFDFALFRDVMIAI
ncbi:MAG: hypothetical protein ACI35T_05420 [Alistipes sp.]